jgi:hypothetical protein
MEVVHDKEDFYHKINNNPNKIYIVNRPRFTLDTFRHYQLPDGIIKDDGKVYLNSLECNIFSEYFNQLGIKKDFSSVNYVSDFSNFHEVACKGKIVVLGRYFTPGKSEIPWGSEPRGVLSKSIYDNKDSTRASNILEWKINFADVLERTLLHYIKKGLEDKYEITSEILKEYIPKVVVTSLPNRDGENRFSSFLKSLDIRFKNSNLVITDNYFLQTRDIQESTRGIGYQNKKRILKDFYKVNEIYSNFNSKRTQIIIIDDVLTTGCHFELAVESLKNSLEESSYEVTGVFLTATQSKINYNDEEKLIKFTEHRYETIQ